MAPDGNSYEYKIDLGELVEFKVEFQLNNYSKEKKSFAIEGYMGYISNLIKYEIYNQQGELERFTLQGKEKKTFKIDNRNRNYLIKIDDFNEQFSTGGGGSGVIDSLYLIDDEGSATNIVKLRDMGIDK